jgi:hypothetical protein
MNVTLRAACIAGVGALLTNRTVASTRNAPADEFVSIVKAFGELGQPAAWEALEQLRGIRWAALPPSALQSCAADGNCFARQGTVTLGGQTLGVLATGARTMVFNVYFRNAGAPIGEAAVLAALRQNALRPVLARCPIQGGAGSTNWYRLNGTNGAPMHLAVQAASGRRNGEGFVLSAGAALPPLQPAQLALYSEQCDAGVKQRPIALTPPHEQLAATVVALLTPASGPSLYPWNALATVATGIAWDSAGVKRGDLSYRNDRNPFMRSGSVAYAGRQFGVLASGTQSAVKTIYFDEQGQHPRGEHMLGIVYQKGIAVQLARCGPVYTESTNNWYSLTSSRTHPAMIRQSIAHDGRQVADAYELRLDNTLPARDPRDRNPGVNGCQ